MRFLIVVMKFSYATFSLMSFNLITRILYGVPRRDVVDAIVHPTDLRGDFLVSAIGLCPVILSFLVLLLLSAKHRWVLMGTVAIGVATSILIALSTSAAPLVIFAVYSVPQLPILLVKNRRRFAEEYPE